MAAEAEVFHYEPHPRIAERKQTPPPKVDDEHVGFNGRLACGVRKLDRVPARGLARLLTSGRPPEFWLVCACAGSHDRRAPLATLTPQASRGWDRRPAANSFQCQ
jgi:hypothetical protein